MTLKQLSVLTGRRYQYLIKILNQPTAGEVFVPGQWNLKAIKKSLHKWYTDEQFVELAGVHIDEIELEKTNRSPSTQRDYVDVEDLEVNGRYVIRNYHYEKEYTLTQIVGTVLLFKGEDGKIKAIDKNTIEDHTKFIAVEEDE